MATQAQIEANRRNAQHSTGPKTEAGKVNSSLNATRFGLFSTNNCVLPGEEEFYDHFCHSLWDALAPVGPIEEITAGEYVRAAWLLRRCVMAAQRLGEYAVRCRAEDNLQYKQDLPVSDPMLRDDCLPSEAAIARARAQAFSIQRRAKADLQKLQAERRARAAELQTEAERPEPVPAPAPQPAAKKAPVTEQSQSEAHPQPEMRPCFLCPCGSTLHFEECCGAVGLFSPPFRPAA